MRLRNVRYAKETIKKYNDVVIDSSEIHKGKWNKIFQNTNPIYLEIGCGKGKFIYESALKYPNINFIGIEKFDSVIIRALEKLIFNPLPNVRLIRIDAEKVDEIFDKSEIDLIYLNFSDPWPKKRQIKRRLTSIRFLKKYENILKENSCIKMKTDNFNLFQYSLMQFNNHKSFYIKDINLNLYKSLPKDNIQTEFEQRFAGKGNLIFYLKAIYKGDFDEKIL